MKQVGVDPGRGRVNLRSIFAPALLWRRLTLVAFTGTLSTLTLLGRVDAGVLGLVLSVLGLLVTLVVPSSRADPPIQKGVCIAIGTAMGLLASLVPTPQSESSRPPAAERPGVAGPILELGQTLFPGEVLASRDGRYQLVVSDRGELIFRDDTEDRELWRLGDGRNAGAYAVLQRDGNFVLRSQRGEFLWATNTDDMPVTRLVVQDRGRVVVEARNSPPLWVSDGAAPVVGAAEPVSNDRLRRWEALRAGKEVRAGKFRLRMETYGDLVLYDGDAPVWHTDTAENYGAALALQADGNLVLYSEPYNPDPNVRAAVWATDTDGVAVEEFRLAPDGTLALIGGDGGSLAVVRAAGAT